MSTCRVRVDEILRVIYSLVLKSLGRQTGICTPAVRHYSSAWPYPLFNEVKKSFRVPRRHRHEKSPSPVPRSYPPKTPKPSTQRPLLYFLCPILASSISTTIPGTPNTSERCSNQNWQTSLQTELQSMTLFLLMDNSRHISKVGCFKTNQRRQKKRHISFWENFCLSNHEPATKLFEKECLFVTFVRPPQHGGTHTQYTGIVFFVNLRNYACLLSKPATSYNTTDKSSTEWRDLIYLLSLLVRQRDRTLTANTETLTSVLPFVRLSVVSHISTRAQQVLRKAIGSS